MKRQFGIGTAGLLVVLALSSPAGATIFKYGFTMNGASENPVNASPATGTGTAFYDNVLHTLTLSASFSGMIGTVSQTHFHATTAVSGLPDNNPPGETANQAAASVTNVGIAVGNPSLPGFPLGVTSGVYAQVLDLTQTSVYNGAFLAANGGTAAGSEAAFASALASGRTYWNIHSNPPGFGGGEIRGFPVPIPEPASVGMALAGLGFLQFRRRRR